MQINWTAVYLAAILAAITHTVTAKVAGKFYVTASLSDGKPAKLTPAAVLDAAKAFSDGKTGTVQSGILVLSISAA
jgi:hypothetical protein